MPGRIAEELRVARKYWKNYVFQSLLATVSIFLVLIILGMDEAVIIASLGATAFVVFALPEKITAHPRNVIGGHFVGLLCGFLGIMALHLLPVTNNIVENAVYALTVGLSIFIMTVTDTEHPPASGTTLGVVLQGAAEHPPPGTVMEEIIKSFDLQIMIQVMIFAVVFSAIRLILKKHLRDLA